MLAVFLEASFALNVVKKGNAGIDRSMDSTMTDFMELAASLSPLEEGFVVVGNGPASVI